MSKDNWEKDLVVGQSKKQREDVRMIELEKQEKDQTPQQEDKSRTQKP